MIDAGVHPYQLTFLVVFLVGLYVLVDARNLVRKLIGLNLLQISVFLLLVTIGYVDGAGPPLMAQEGPHANPLPHALVLTAIVVGVSLTALALAIVIRLHAEFGTTDVIEIERVLASEERRQRSIGDDPHDGDDPDRETIGDTTTDTVNERSADG